MSVSVYTGWLRETLFYGRNDEFQTTQKPLKIKDKPIEWDAGRTPDGWQDGTLSSPVAGYVLQTDIYYAFTGDWRSALGSSQGQMIVTLWDSVSTATNRIDYITVNVRDALYWQAWDYGPPVIEGPIPQNYLDRVDRDRVAYLVKGSPRIKVPGGIAFQTWSRTVYRDKNPANMTFQILIRVTVTQDCNESNINAPVCKTICLADPTTPACANNYFDYCLRGDPERVAEPVCKEYLLSYINVNKGSIDPIDQQFRRYCEKYTSLQDFLDKTASLPDDRSICGCNIKSHEVDDPNATVLYTNYYNSVVKKWPGFKYFSLKEKCVFGACATSEFVYSGAGRACNVPDCIQVVEIDNDGTIDGDINVDQSCNGYKNAADPSKFEWSWTLIIILIVIAIVVFIVIVYFFSILGSNRNTISENVSASGTYNPSVQT